MRKTFRNILIFRRGLLGDNLVAAPALRCLRQAYPQAHLVLVSEVAPGENWCWAERVFGPSGLVDEVIPFVAYNSPSRWRQVSATLNLFRTLRSTPWDLGVALDMVGKVGWEPTILRTLGAKVILAPRSNNSNHQASTEKCPSVPHVADQLLDILRPLGLLLPESGQGSMDVNITSQEVSEMDNWLRHTGAGDAPKPWIALGPWTNMPVKQWPTDRFTKMARVLQDKVGGTLFIFGGPQEMEATRNLVRTWGFAIPVAGSLSVRQGIALLKRCNLFIGNDSGTMHMAVSAGIRCVAIFSSRDKPKLWEPYGSGHVVLRKSVPCEGCMMNKCIIHSNKCINSINIQDILNACKKINLSTFKNKTDSLLLRVA